VIGGEGRVGGLATEHLRELVVWNRTNVDRSGQCVSRIGSWERRSAHRRTVNGTKLGGRKVLSGKRLAVRCEPNLSDSRRCEAVKKAHCEIIMPALPTKAQCPTSTTIKRLVLTAAMQWSLPQPDDMITQKGMILLT
jgi:hypothetical protein